jgi:kynurenine formamidase
LTRRIVDLSVTLKAGIKSDPPNMLPAITYTDHKTGFGEFAKMFPGLTPADMPEGEAGAAERLQVSTHAGTHMDAPWHYHSTQDHELRPGGRPSETIDQIDLDLCFQPGVKLDFRHLPDGHVVTAAQVEAELERIGHRLQPKDIVLVNTAAGARYGEDDFLDKGVGMGREATLYLTRAGVKVVGTDAWSWDAPFKYTVQKFRETGDSSIIWEGHKAGRARGYYQMEKLSNLESLPGDGFYVSCFPAKIERASAGWTRCVAIFDPALAVQPG